MLVQHGEGGDQRIRQLAVRNHVRYLHARSGSFILVLEQENGLVDRFHDTDDVFLKPEYEVRIPAHGVLDGIRALVFHPLQGQQPYYGDHPHAEPDSEALGEPVLREKAFADERACASNGIAPRMFGRR